jgi:hypothetical protein
MSRRVAVAALAVAALAASPARAGELPTWKARVAAATRYAEARVGVVSFAVVDESGRMHGTGSARSPRPRAS